MAEPTFRDLAKEPQSMKTCCEILRIQYGSQVHREILYAVSHLTAFHKTKGDRNKYHGIVVRREKKPSSFSPQFLQLVNEFLKKLRGGIIFFPSIIPHYKGYDTSYVEERLVWISPMDQDVIEVGFALLVESMASNPFYSSRKFIDDAVLYDSFIEKDGDCDDCGSGETSEGNDIVYCHHCKIGYHQECRDIYPIPPPKERWFCSTCMATNARGTKKHAKSKSISSEKDAPMLYSISKKSESPVITSPRRSSNKRGSVSLSRAEATETSALVSAPKRSRLSYDLHGLAISPDTPSFAKVPRPLTFTATNDLPLMSPSPSTAGITSRVKLAVRMLEEPVIRLVELEGDVWHFISQCAKTWPTKFLHEGEIHRILVQFDVIGGYLEIARSTAEVNYAEFLELVKRLERKSDGEKILYVPVLVLAKGEVAPGF